ncbi:MAG: MBL fold metallo-hydrolase [Puniceicoccales bacterium]|jgi:glyoxylase-like metal-dependent hydrolase (beta-lactamase superfamily II)|nr:MBL fold metallo-hydrolase [Puniceicoccales bacterium]
MLNIHAYTFGPYENCVYVMYANVKKVAVIIDAASGSFDGLKKCLADHEIHLFLTHGHWDHMCEAAKFQRELKAVVYAHKADQDWFTTEQSKYAPPGIFFETIAPDVWVEHGQMIQCSDLVIKVLHTPGHTLGQIALYMESLGSVFVGDTLFRRTVGRTDLPGGNFDQLKDSVRRILYTLPEDTVVYPGHGEKTSIGAEQKHNPIVPLGENSL